MFHWTRNGSDIGYPPLCILNILGNGLSRYLMESVSVGAVCNGKCTYFMSSSRPPFVLSPRWITRTSPDGGRKLGYNVDAVNAGRSRLIKV